MARTVYEDENFARYLEKRSAGFNPYGAGAKRYGPGAASSPHFGGGLDRLGYRERDLKKKTLRNAMLRRMKARRVGNFMSSDNLDPRNRSF